MSQSQIAKALGISQPAVAQLSKKGMPTDSVEAAQAWRSANIGVKAGQGYAGRAAAVRARRPSEPAELSDELAVTDRLRRLAVQDFENAGSIQERAAASRTVRDAEEAHETRKRDMIKSELESQTLMHRDQVQGIISEEAGKLRALLEAMPSSIAQAANPADPELARDTVADYLEQVFSTLSNTGNALRLDT
jgi:transcriptional regulator with XRE-family HTH domain